jgi:imidazolonepropionase-like amidohydrolase
MYPGASVHVELEELVRAGLTPYEAIAAGTVVPGRFLGEHVASAPRLGVVAPGYAADLLLVAGNPLVDVSVLRRPIGVVRGGLVMPPN